MVLPKEKCVLEQVKRKEYSKDILTLSFILIVSMQYSVLTFSYTIYDF